MEGPALEDAGDLDPRDKANAQLFGPFSGDFYPVDAVVVGEGNTLASSVFGELDDCLWGVRTVRKSRMGMQVYHRALLSVVRVFIFKGIAFADN